MAVRVAFQSSSQANGIDHRRDLKTFDGHQRRVLKLQQPANQVSRCLPYPAVRVSLSARFEFVKSRDKDAARAARRRFWKERHLSFHVHRSFQASPASSR